MKGNRLIICTLAFLLPFLCFAQEKQGFERSYVSTDRHAYLSGDRIWCSVFNFDARSGELSSSSAVAYLQLMSPDNTAATAKIALFGGRGGGYLDIPSSLPTGNYALICFTADNKNEALYDFACNAKTISVYNPFTVQKQPDAVAFEAVTEALSLPVRNQSAVKVDVPVSVKALDTLRFSASASQPATMSVSLARRNHLPVYSAGNIEDFRRFAPEDAVFEQNVISEYDGEVVYTVIEGPDKDKVLERGYATGYLSSIGEKNDTYTAQMTPDGNVVFRTYNIFGDKDIISQVDADGSINAHMDLIPPFVELPGLSIPALHIDKSLKGAVEDMRPSFQNGELLQWPEHPVLLGKDCKVYELDNYTRFPTLREVLVEIVTELRARGDNDKFRIEILLRDNFGRATQKWNPGLVLMDGVPVFQHSKLLNFDAMKIDRIEVWTSPYCYGDRVYKGVANFVTKDGGIEYIKFGSNVRIVSFQGVSYPMMCSERPQDGPDCRETVFWHPLLKLEAAQTCTLECPVPSRPGLYELTMEGVLEDGSVFCQRSLVRVD